MPRAARAGAPGDLADAQPPEGGDADSRARVDTARIRSRVVSSLCAVLVGAAALALSACSSEESAAGSSFEPAKPGVLTVATAFLPAPGFWEGRSADAGGFEAGLALALAKHLGLDRVKVVQVPFASLAAGKLGGADIALSQLTPTEEREKVVDFSSQYLSAPPAILALRTVDASDVHGLQELSWVTSRVSTLTPFVQERIRPKSPPLVVEDRTAALTVLRGGGAEALMLDLPVAEGLAHSDPDRFHVLGQLDADEGLAAALPQGSHNVEVVDSAIHFLTADGTIDDLVHRWLGEDESDVPLILTESR
jgi:ABC-type amino acid transport substrate-binding protein